MKRRKGKDEDEERGGEGKDVDEETGGEGKDEDEEGISEGQKKNISLWKVPKWWRILPRPHSPHLPRGDECHLSISSHLSSSSLFPIFIFFFIHFTRNLFPPKKNEKGKSAADGSFWVL